MITLPGPQARLLRKPALASHLQGSLDSCSFLCFASPCQRQTRLCCNLTCLLFCLIYSSIVIPITIRIVFKLLTMARLPYMTWLLLVSISPERLACLLKPGLPGWVGPAMLILTLGDSIWFPPSRKMPVQKSPPHRGPPRLLRLKDQFVAICCLLIPNPASSFFLAFVCSHPFDTVINLYKTLFNGV